MFEKDGPMPFGPPMGLNKSMFTELREIIFLWAISEEEGLTGYKIEQIYHTPHSNVVRILNNLKEKEFIETNEETVKGRPQKLCSITENGRDHLKNLRGKWAEKIEFLSDIVPRESFPRSFFGGLSSRTGDLPHSSKLPHFFKNFAEGIKTKEGATSFITGLELKFDLVKRQMQKRMVYLDDAILDAKETVDEIEKMPDDNPEELRKLITTRFEKFRKKIEEEEKKEEK